MVTKEITLLQHLLADIDRIDEHNRHNSEYTVEAWKSSAVSVIERIFGRLSRKIEEIERLELGRSFSLDGPSTHYFVAFKGTARALINVFIRELEHLGLPDELPDQKGINLTVIQSQSNKQTIKLNLIVEALRNELTGNQLEELQSILDKEQPPEAKKESIVTKLNSFGSDVLSNVIAGIITNPAIFS